MRQTSENRQKSRIVIVGGGAGGLELATRLGHTLRHAAEITLVDREISHFWKPRLHELATGLIGAGEDNLSFLAHGVVHNYRFLLGPIIGLDPARRILRLGVTRNPETDEVIVDERDVPYDQLVLAFGSRVNDFGTPGVAEYCDMLDSARQALVVQRRLLSLVIENSVGRLERIRVGVVGAGATGVEFAAELHQAFDIVRAYGRLGGRDRLLVTLIDRSERVLPSASAQTSATVDARLRRMGVELRLGMGVERVEADGFHLSSGEVVPCELKLWAAGVSGQEVAGRLGGLSLAKDRRILVDETLACRGVADVFAMGDCAAAPGEGGRFVPPTAQAANQQAAYLAASLARRLAGKPVRPFRFRARGTLVSLGSNEAAADFPGPGKDRSGFSTSGAVPKLLYVSLQYFHRVALHGWIRATALFLSDRLRRMTFPPIKLH